MTLHCREPELVIPGVREHESQPDPGSVHLWFATLNALRPRLDKYIELLDPVEQERAHRFRFVHDRERFVLGHGMLRELLGRYLQSDAASLRFARGPHGKPYLEHAHVHFNFSDTKDAILMGIRVGHALGVDIETLARDVDHEAVSTHYFTHQEIEAIRGAGSDAKQRFLEFWTRKEAVLKASGVGIMEDLRVLRVDAPHNVMSISHETFKEMAAFEYHLRSWRTGAGHIFSLATADPVREVALYSYA